MFYSGYIAIYNEQINKVLPDPHNYAKLLFDLVLTTSVGICFSVGLLAKIFSVAKLKEITEEPVVPAHQIQNFLNCRDS